MKVVAVDYLDYDESWEQQQLADADAEFVAYHPQKGAQVPVLEWAKDADVLVVAAVKVDRAVLEGLPKLKAVIRLGVGVDNVDVEAATELGVVVANMPGFCTREVAEHAAALLLACVRRIGTYGPAIAEGRWSREAAEELELLRGKTLGVVGCGRIGSEFLRVVRGFGLRRIVYDPYISDARVRRFGAERVGLDKLLASSDIVSIHAPLTEETRHMFDRSAFARMKRGAILINTARGPIVDESALLEALEEGIVSMAGLDVFETEPLPTSNPLFRHPRVIATPHVAWYSKQSQTRQREWVVEDIRRLVRGKKPQHTVNPAVYKRKNLRLRSVA